MADSNNPTHHNKVAELALHNMADDVFFEKTADTFKLISDASRVKILLLLCHTEACVSDIASSVNMTSPAVSHHISVLKNAGILAREKKGREAYYTLADTEDAQMVHHVVDAIFGLNCSEE